MKILLVLIALVAADIDFGPRPREIPFKEYQDYQKKYNKTYACPELEELRFNIYKYNVHDIEEQNRQHEIGNSTWTAEINRFTDTLYYEYNGIPSTTPAPLVPWETQFEDFKKEYNRKYGCPEEEALRFKIFKHTVEEIEEFNKEKHGWEMGINKFADMAGDELRPFFGAIIHDKDHKQSV